MEERMKPSNEGTVKVERPVRPRTWVFAWSNWQKTERTILTLHDRTEEDALEVAKEMGWTPIRWWQWWRWFSDEDYHGAA